MPTPSSGTITYYNLGHFSLGSSYNGFQDTNIGINAFFRGGYWVPNIGAPTNNQSVPASASNMGMNMYYNVWGYRRLSFTLTVGKYVTTGKFNFNYYGYLAPTGDAPTTNGNGPGNTTTIGSISASQYVTVYGTMYIVAINVDDFGENAITISSNSRPPNNIFTFISLYSSYSNYNYAFSTFTGTNGAGTYNTFFYNYNTTAYSPNYPQILPASPGGTYSLYLNYYG